MFPMQKYKNICDTKQCRFLNKTNIHENLFKSSWKFKNDKKSYQDSRLYNQKLLFSSWQFQPLSFKFFKIKLEK